MVWRNFIHSSFALLGILGYFLVTCNCPTLQKACLTLFINNACIGWIIIFMTINGCSWKTESLLSSAPLHVMFNFITFLNLGEFSLTSSSSASLCSSFAPEKRKVSQIFTHWHFIFFPCLFSWISLWYLALVSFKLLRMCLAHECMKIFIYTLAISFHCNFTCHNLREFWAPLSFFYRWCSSSYAFQLNSRLHAIFNIFIFYILSTSRWSATS